MPYADPAKKLEAQRRYRAKAREAERRYRQSAKGREQKRRYEQSEVGREARRRYNQSEVGRETRSRYQRSEGRWMHHGITLAQAAWLLASQQGRCAVHGELLTLETAEVDHDHGCCPKWSCGRCIRGLVCRACNILVGLVESGKRAAAPEVAVYLTHGPVRFPAALDRPA